MKLNLHLVTLIVITQLSIITPGTIQATDINGSMSFGGKTRTYLLHVPSSYNASQATPLLLVFHGLSSSGSQMADITGFSSIADQENFIVVYPDGLNKKWASPNKSPDDVGFISALIDLLSTNYNIDAAKIFATGASNGGMFTYRLGLELTDRISGIAAVAGYMPSYSTSAPTPTRPISVVIFHGTTDGIIPYNESENAANYWADFDDCSSSPTTVQLPNTDPNDGTTVDQMTYAGGSDSTQVVLYKIYNGGHTWPGTSSHAMPGQVCKDISASQIIWDFFSGNTSTTSVPVVSITSPASGYSFTAPASIALKATASEVDGTIKKVKFYNGSNFIKVDSVAPYACVWKNVSVGNYTLIASATDNNGVTGSDTVTITVNPQRTSFGNFESNFIETHYDLSNQQFIITKADDLSGYDLFIYDSFGRNILSLQGVHDSKKIISAGSFVQGVYMYCIKTNDMDSPTGKFIVTR